MAQLASAVEVVAGPGTANPVAAPTLPPAVETEAPVETEEAPAETEEVPAETEEAPVETEEAPAETEEAPVDTEEAPVDTEEAPVDTEEAPVEPEAESPTETPTKKANKRQVPCKRLQLDKATLKPELDVLRDVIAKGLVFEIDGIACNLVNHVFGPGSAEALDIRRLPHLEKDWEKKKSLMVRLVESSVGDVPSNISRSFQKIQDHIDDRITADLSKIDTELLRLKGVPGCQRRGGERLRVLDQQGE